MFIDVGDIHSDRQHFHIFCQFEQTKNGDKSAISKLDPDETTKDSWEDCS